MTEHDTGGSWNGSSGHKLNLDEQLYIIILKDKINKKKSAYQEDEYP